MPDLAGRLYLKHAAFIRVKKIISLWDTVGIGRLNRAASPTSRPDAAAVLFDLDYQVKSVIHAILDACGSSGY
jgi:hypothetical protein